MAIGADRAIRVETAEEPRPPAVARLPTSPAAGGMRPAALNIRVAATAQAIRPSKNTGAF
jgi:hypothetical protein